MRRAGSPAAAHRDLPFRRRALQPCAGPRSALRRPQRLRPQGRHARGWGEGRRPHLRARGPGAGRQQPRRPDLRALRQGLGDEPGRGRRHRARRRRRQAGRRAAQGARAPRLSVRGGERLLRAAAAARDRLVRAALPAGGLPGDHREARRRQGRDGGDDQDLGRRPAPRADRRGPRAGERTRPSPPRRDHRPPSAPGRHRAGQLQGQDPRCAPRDGSGDARLARLLRRAGVLGVDRRLGEHHRGVVGGARRLARVRVPAEDDDQERGAGRPSPPPSGPQRLRERRRADSPRPRRARRARGGAGARGAALRAALAGADAGALRARLRRLARGR